MWITPSRLAYCGLIGSPGPRRLGAWLFYIALESPFTVTIGRDRAVRNAVLIPPWTRHCIASPDRQIGQIMIESETIAPSENLQSLIVGAARQDELRRKLLDWTQAKPAATQCFDSYFFGRALRMPELDSRIVKSFSRIDTPGEDELSARSCAQSVSLSLSRFRHLFAEQTGTTFRRTRAWKRARRLMFQIGSNARMVDIALSSGYADSTHFSHSVRQFFGYSPRDIFEGPHTVRLLAYRGR